MMNLPSKQVGKSFYDWMIILFVSGFFVMVGLKLYPAYFDARSVSSAIQSLGETEGITTMSTRQIREKISKLLRINNVRGLDLDPMDIKKTNTKLVVDFNYEQRVELVGNVDVVMKFENHFEKVLR